jgi:hypothetical protein
VDGAKTGLFLSAFALRPKQLRLASVAQFQSQAEQECCPNYPAWFPKRLVKLVLATAISRLPKTPTGLLWHYFVGILAVPEQISHYSNQPLPVA